MITNYNEFLMENVDYWLNNDSVAIGIYNSNRFIKTHTKLDTCSNLDSLIRYIKEHPNKAIKIGKRVNATSTHLTSNDFKVLSELFPHLVV